MDYEGTEEPVTNVRLPANYCLAKTYNPRMRMMIVWNNTEWSRSRPLIFAVTLLTTTFAQVYLYAFEVYTYPCCPEEEVPPAKKVPLKKGIGTYMRASCTAVGNDFTNSSV